MPKTAAARSAKRSYHHGDLRRALLDAAWQLVRKHGVDALTLREVARKVGVTHAAPYHHFESREALLDALTGEAFGVLDREMSAAIADLTDPSERLSALGRAYIDHAREHPERLQVMFRRRATVAPPLDPESHGARVFNYLLDAVSACQAAEVAPAGDPWELALSAWSIVHGFSKLWIEGPLDQMPPYQERFELLRDQTLRDQAEGWRARAKAGSS